MWSSNLFIDRALHDRLDWLYALPLQMRDWRPPSRFPECF